MKYVIVKTNRKVYPFIFAEHLVHSEAARRFTHLVGFDSNDGPAEVHSAGFCHIHDNQFQVNHGSESLRIEPDRRQGFEDYQILNMPAALQGMFPVTKRREIEI